MKLKCTTVVVVEFSQEDLESMLNEQNYNSNLFSDLESDCPDCYKLIDMLTSKAASLEIEQNL